MFEPRREFRCFSCGHEWTVPYGTGRVLSCPKCGSFRIKRMNPGPPPGRRGWHWRMRWGRKL